MRLFLGQIGLFGDEETPIGQAKQPSERNSTHDYPLDHAQFTMR